MTVVQVTQVEHMLFPSHLGSLEALSPSSCTSPPLKLTAAMAKDLSEALVPWWSSHNWCW